MLTSSGLLRNLLLTIALVGSASAVTLDTACPNTGISDTMIAIGGAPEGNHTTFCVSSFGWSNGWFATTNPGTAPDNANINLLGDSAQYLSYTTDSGSVGMWLTPTLSSGTSTGSTFTVATAVHKIDDNQAESVITNGDVNITINSKVVRNNIRMTFTILNLLDSTITNLQIVQYLNYFSYGSTNPDLGTMTYQKVPTLEDTMVDGLWVGSQNDGNVLIREGGVCGGPGTAGCSTPDAHDIGAPEDVIADIYAGSFNGVDSAPMNAAGALAWNLGDLQSLESTQFTVELVPEPGTTSMLLFGTAGLLVWSRRLRKRA